VYKNRLVGAILYGDTGPMAELKSLIESQLELDDSRRSLLRGGGTQREPVEGRLVCSCNQVGEGNLFRAIAQGCETMESLCSKTGAGTGCGSCKPEVAALMDRSAALAAG
jgi:ferredoxin-nitrate reductase